MAIARATINTDIWDTIRGYLNDSSVTNIAKLVSAYAKSFTKDASSKDFVVLHSPGITETRLTFTKISYPFTMQVEVVVSEEEQMKVLNAAIRARVAASLNNARGDGIFNLRISGDTTSYETREDVRILHNIITLEGIYRGET